MQGILQEINYQLADINPHFHSRKHAKILNNRHCKYKGLFDSRGVTTPLYRSAVSTIFPRMKGEQAYFYASSKTHVAKLLTHHIAAKGR